MPQTLHKGMKHPNLKEDIANDVQTTARLEICKIVGRIICVQ
jgi:hypothetical protein